jgi:hypothetical protein
LVNLPKLYDTFNGEQDSSLKLKDMVAKIPLALRVADAGRLGFFTLANRDLVPWNMPGQSETVAFLVRQQALREEIQAAIDFLLRPGPLTERVATLEYELTISPTATVTFTPTETSTRTQTPTRTETLTRTITRTPTITRTFTVTRTRTITLTRTVTKTPTPSVTPTP